MTLQAIQAITLHILNEIDEKIQELENASKTNFKWFNDNQAKANADKCHFLSNLNSEISVIGKRENIRLKFHFKLNFDSHICDIFKGRRVKDTRTMPLVSFWCLTINLNIFHTLFWCFYC